MKTYTLSGEVTVSVYTKVKANSLEEAVQIAEQRDIKEYEWGRSYEEEEYWLNAEYDGEVTNIQET